MQGCNKKQYIRYSFSHHEILQVCRLFARGVSPKFTLGAYSRICPNLIQHLYIFLLDKKITTANVKSPLMITNSLSTKSRTLVQLISFLNRGVNFFERFNAEFHFRFNREKVFSVGRSLERIFQR